MNTNPGFLAPNDPPATAAKLDMTKDMDEMEMSMTENPNEDHTEHQGALHEEVDEWGYAEPQLVLGSLF